MVVLEVKEYGAKQAKELSFCHKLKSLDPYIYTT